MLEIANNLFNISHIVRVKIKLAESVHIRLSDNMAILSQLMIEIANNLLNISHIVRIIDHS